MPVGRRRATQYSYDQEYSDHEMDNLATGMFILILYSYITPEIKLYSREQGLD